MAFKIPDGAGQYLQLPSLTTTQRDALTPAEGMIIKNSTTENVEKYVDGGWKAANQPERYAATVSASIAANSDGTVSLTLAKKGYTTGFAVLQGPIAIGNSGGRAGLIVQIRQAAGTGHIGSVQSAAYSACFSTLVTASQLSDNIMDTTAKIRLKDVRLDADGDTVEIILTNTDTTTARTYSIAATVWVW